MPTRLLINVDGGSRGNPGPAAAGVVLRDADTNRPVFEAGYALPRMTNNVAEYHGLIRALRAAAERKPDEVHIDADSELMVRQILGEYRVRSPDLQPLFEQAQLLLLQLGNWSIRHVPRAMNARADELANLAMDSGRDVFPMSQAKPAGRPTAASARKPSGDVEHDPATRSGHIDDAPPASFEARFLDAPGPACPADCSTAKAYRFPPANPGTPESSGSSAASASPATAPAGFCPHAAEAVRLYAHHANDAGLQRPPDFPCPRCGARIRLTR